MSAIQSVHECLYCGLLPENIKVKPYKHCIAITAYEPVLGASKPSEFEGLLKEHVRKYHNVGGSTFIINDEIKEIYRSADLAESPEALQELVQERKIKTLINLHYFERFDLKPWIEKESEMFYRFGGINYITISDFAYKISPENNKEKIFRNIANIIKQIIQCEGNVLIHCGGGEHRTGIIYAILQRCFQQIPLDQIIQDFKCHCAWISMQSPGGYYESHADLIREFPIELVRQ